MNRDASSGKESMGLASGFVFVIPPISEMRLEG